MDRVVMSGALVSDSLEAVFVVACIRLAAASEGKYLPRDVSMGKQVFLNVDFSCRFFLFN